MIESILGGKTYILRNINPNKWSGIKSYEFTNDDIGPDLNQQGLPVTGLTENYYETDDKGRKKEVKGTRIIMEERLGLDPGTLKKGSLQKHSDFWVNYTVRYDGSDLKLDTNIPENELAVLFLKAQSVVAFGVANIKAKSEYVLFTKEEEAKQSNARKKTRRSAYTLFEKLTQEDMSEVLEMTGVKVASLTADVIEDKLSDYMEEYPKKFIAMVEDPSRKHKTYIRRCLDKGIMFLEDGAVMYGETVLGYDVDTAATKLFSDEGAKTREAIKIQMEAK